MENNSQSTLKKVTINGTQYNVAELPEEAQKQLMNIQVTETEVKRLQAKLAIAQTALSAYQQAMYAVIQKEKG